MEDRDELKGLHREVELSLVKRFLEEHQVVQVLMLAGTEEIRDWFANLVRQFIDEGESELVGLLALWLVMKSPRDTLINLAVWLETEGSPGGEDDPATFAAGEDEGDFAQPTASPETAARHQAARVMLEKAKARRRPPAKAVGCAPILAVIGAFMIMAGGAVAIYRWHISPSQAEEGFVSLKAAVSKNRRIPLRISGGLPYSPYTATPLTGDFEFDRAESELSFATKNGPPSSRLNLARVYLARARPGNPEKALRLLDDLRSSAGKSAEILNETGIANFMLGRYAEAISRFTEALRAEPKMAEALFNKAYTEERVDRRAAHHDWEQFIASTSDPDWIAEARERLTVFD
jgi:tetratricopeptide (TPR) repeat protein